jgi:glycosyltransferase involved in cell wall biosynthesis
MQIIFINRFFWPDHSATSQLLTDLAFHLSKAGQSVHVITSRQVYDDPNAVLPTQANMSNVHVTRVWTTHFGRQHLLGRTVDYLTFYLSAALNLLLLLKPGDIVVAKTDPPLVSVIAAMAAKLRGAKLINWIQDLFPEVAGALEVGGLGKIEGILRTVRNWSFRSASKNVAIGDGMAKRIAEEGINPDTITVIHNWSDGRAIQPIDRKKNDLRREWGLEDVFVVGYSGNLGRAHEFDTILGAAEKLKHTGGIVFLFIGGGAQRGWIEEDAKKRGLTNILFKPYQPRERLGLSLSVPDVHLISLQPALEGLIVPSKFYGIAAAGRPTLFVGDMDGEIPTILRKTSSGYTISIGDSNGLASRIVEMSHGTIAGSMGARARVAFEQNFEQHHAFAAWEYLLQEVSAAEG